MPTAIHMTTLTLDDAEPYLHCFERDYWTCDLPSTQPLGDAHLPRRVRRASLDGTVAIDTVATSNGGLVIPAYQETRDHGTIPASGVDQGTMAKVVIEGLTTRDRDPEIFDLFAPSASAAEQYSMRTTTEYFAIDQVTPTEVRTYQQSADWLVAAQTRAGRDARSWFPLEVDYDSSIDAGPYVDEMNRVWVEGAHTKAGVPTLELGVTLPTEPLGYRRLVRAVLHQPVIIPDTSGMLPLRRRF